MQVLLVHAFASVLVFLTKYCYCYATVLLLLFADRHRRIQKIVFRMLTFDVREWRLWSMGRGFIISPVDCDFTRVLMHFGS